MCVCVWGGGGGGGGGGGKRGFSSETQKFIRMNHPESFTFALLLPIFLS